MELAPPKAVLNSERHRQDACATLGAGTPNIEHRTSNIEHPTLNGEPAEDGTPNRNSRTRTGTRRNLVMGSRGTSTTAMPGCRYGGQAAPPKAMVKVWFSWNSPLRKLYSTPKDTGRMPVPHWEPGRHTSNIQHPTLNGGPAEAGTSLGSGEPRKPLKAIRATWRSLLRGQQFHHRFHRRISLDGLHLRPDLSGFEFYFAFGE